MVCCKRCDVMVPYRKRYFCKGDGEVSKSLEIYAAKWSFRILGMTEGPLGVWLGPFYIEPNYVTRSELSWRGKKTNKEKSLTKQVVSLEGFCFLAKRRKLGTLRLMKLLSQLSIITIITGWWHLLLGGQYLALNSWFS